MQILQALNVLSILSFKANNIDMRMVQALVWNKIFFTETLLVDVIIENQDEN